MRALTVIGLALLGLVGHARLEAQSLDEYGVKSAFVYNFLQFVGWSASKLGPADALTICVLDEHPIARHLSASEGRVVREHPIRVRTIGALQDAAVCHVIFVGADNAARLPELNAQHPRGGLLIIFEGRAAAQVIGLSAENNRIVFDVNLDVAANQGLTLGSKLLRLARRVSGAPGTADVRRQPEGR